MFKLLFISFSLLTAFISSTNVSYANSNTRTVCSGDSQYLKRQLNSQKTDNICQTYRGKVMLIVNTASRCAYTDQYDDLEKLYAQYRTQGLVVLGFPSNDFGAQEPGTEKNIQSFCRLTYGVKFPMYEKTRVKGNAQDPLYKQLIKVSGQAPNWNFHKYLIARNGELIASYNSHISPLSDAVVNKIKVALEKQ